METKKIQFGSRGDGRAIDQFAAEKSPAGKSELSDKQLFQLCQEYGMNARKWSRKFAALLPEVSKRELYIRHGFYSIYEFAAKLGGLNQKTVEEVLRVYRRVEDKPFLKAEIENQGWGKVRTVAAIATTENEETLADLVKTLSKKALEEYVRGVKRQEAKEHEASVEVGARDRAARGEGAEDQTMICLDSNSADVSVNSLANKFVCSATPPGWGLIEENRCEKVGEAAKKWVRVSFKLDPETELRLRKYQQKLEKEKKQAVGFNEVVKNLLDGVEEGPKKIRKDRAQKMGREKSAVVREESGVLVNQKMVVVCGGSKKIDLARVKQEKCKETGVRQAKQKKSATRYIPSEIRRRLDKKYQGRCGYPGCNKPHEVLHHPRRFALTKNHEDVVPLCHEHHQIAHAGLIEEDGQEEKWRLRGEPDRISLTRLVDQRMAKFRGG